jgi:hypothetical protein
VATHTESGCMLPTVDFYSKPIAKNTRNQSSKPVRIWLGTQQAVTAKNDGGLVLARTGNWTGSSRYGTIPLLSCEVSIACNLKMHQVHILLGEAKTRRGRSSSFRRGRTLLLKYPSSRSRGTFGTSNGACQTVKQPSLDRPRGFCHQHSQHLSETYCCLVQ